MNPVRFALDAAGSAPVPMATGVTVLQQVKIDALDITVVKGGGADVAVWAEQNGFDLTPDTPDVLGISNDGAIFALAKFDNDAAASRGRRGPGSGHPLHDPDPRPLGAAADPGPGEGGRRAGRRRRVPPRRPPARGQPRGLDHLGVDRPAGRASVAEPTGRSPVRQGHGLAPGLGHVADGAHPVGPGEQIGYNLSIDGGGPRAVFGGIVHGAPFTSWPLWIALAGLAALIAVGARHGRGSAAA